MQKVRERMECGKLKINEDRWIAARFSYISNKFITNILDVYILNFNTLIKRSHNTL